MMRKIRRNTQKRGKPFELGNPGRSKGSKNKFTTLKDAFLNVFKKLGGEEELLNWANESNHNKGLFYSWITKMLPTNVDVSGGLSHHLSVVYRQEKKDESGSTVG